VRLVSHRRVELRELCRVFARVLGDLLCEVVVLDPDVGPNKLLTDQRARTVENTHIDTLVSIVGSVRTLFQLLWLPSIRECANLLDQP
jgi:hypothetical protein